MAMGNVTETFFNLGSFGLIKKGAVKGFFGSKVADVASSPIPLPQPPSAEATGDKASDIIRKKRAGASQTVFTDPLGVASQANIARKTLLGQ